ncbi:iron complex transport system ATP-binding protein [Williamsia limnetica]|uniref:Iron complex transport system ATP-binding protein n=1 Tax=Williamsia limnetica TaxID=882452 RepID=A0A318RVD5_WILLI|nr:ABC transporter ATP-binding protein [Williamsia limnetica]PYE20682.1 iron complex transport system ATP-binding protein [Williamsia limnetica]
MTKDHDLRVESLSVSYGVSQKTQRGGARLVDDVVKELSLAVPPGQITAIVGANACGKSTLLRTMARLHAPRLGHVVLDGKAVHGLPTKEVAAILGLLPQSPIAPDQIKVADLVARGRYPHQGWFRTWTARDEEAVTAALVATGTLDLANRHVDEISGGQRQRVWIAMTLAQETDILLLDEPTTFLDMSHQVEVLDLITDLNRSIGTTVVVVLHDLNLAARYADTLVAMRKGQIVAVGPPADVVTPQVISQVFDMDVQVGLDPVAGSPVVYPIGRHHAPSFTTSQIEEKR